MNSEHSGLSALTARSNSEIKREKSPVCHVVSSMASRSASDSDAALFRHAFADARRRKFVRRYGNVAVGFSVELGEDVRCLRPVCAGRHSVVGCAGDSSLSCAWLRFSLAIYSLALESAATGDLYHYAAALDERGSSHLCLDCYFG